MLARNSCRWSTASGRAIALGRFGAELDDFVVSPPAVTHQLSAVGLGLSGGSALLAAGAIPGVWGTDWRTATGFTQNAVRDGGVWTGHQNAGAELMLVIPNPGNLGFPAGMQNLLQIFMVDPAPGVSVGGSFGGGWGVPGVGGHRYLRYYVLTSRVTTAGANDINHWWLPEPNSGSWAIHQDNGPRTANGHHWWMRAPDTVAGYHSWTSVAGSQFPIQDVLQLDTVYRIEWHWHRLSLTTYTVETRVYEGDSLTPLFDETTARCNNGNHAAHQSQSATIHTIAEATFNDFGGARLAWEGGGGGYVGVYPDDYKIFGGIAVSATGWCGPYGNVLYNGRLL